MVVLNSSGSLFVERRFTGQRWDDAIDLYDYQTRYYDPVLGRFVQPASLPPVSGAGVPGSGNRRR